MKTAVYAGNGAVYANMEVAAKSLVANSDVDEVVFFIEDDEFPSKLPEMVKTRNVRDQRYFPEGGPNMKTCYSYMALMRAAVCKELTWCDKALVLDTDTIAVRDMSHVWDIDMEGCYIAATPEWHRTTQHGFMYCNCGVVLQDLAKLREWKADEIIDALNRRYYRWVDQDVYSYTCQGHIAEMSPEYNANHWTIRGFFDFPTEKRIEIARIVHYAGVKGFEVMDEYKIYDEMSWDEALEQHNG